VKLFSSGSLVCCREWLVGGGLGMVSSVAIRNSGGEREGRSGFMVGIAAWAKDLRGASIAGEPANASSELHWMRRLPSSRAKSWMESMEMELLRCLRGETRGGRAGF
jgi:hypothetical protein